MADSELDELARLLRQRGASEAVVAHVRRLLDDPSGGSEGSARDTLVDRARSSTAPAPPRLSRAPTKASRLEKVALIARGGMGEVHRVHDRTLGRQLAMKVLHEGGEETRWARARFLEEARVTAQLTHPGIPPVHEIGELPDGRPYFTMKEVHGHTLAARIEGLSGTRGHERWSERRRLEIFQKVCEAVAYAHARGVVHCDLKPLNIMVGAFGEVLVMDWGVAVLTDPVGGLDEPPVTGAGGAHRVMAGTPAYMSPEQAGGDLSDIGPPSDVYALGVILYELLSGVRPYGGSTRQLFFKSVQGDVPPLPSRPGSIVDARLEAIIARAMAPDASARYPSAAPLAEELAQWREGALRRDTALGWVREAEGTLRAIEPVWERARRLQDKARRTLARLEANAPIDAKAEAWAAADEGANLARAAELRTLEVAQRLVGALMHAPALPEAETLLARIHYERHREAARRGDVGAAARHELRLRAYDRGEHAAYLTGRARLRLRTEPQSTVRLFRYVQRDRRLVPEWVEHKEARASPLDCELPIGSYLLELRARDRPPVRYPVVLSRLEGWHGESVWLPPEGVVGPDERYVAEGWFLRGEPGVRGWLDRFVVQARPITMAEAARFFASPEGAPFRAQAMRDGLPVQCADWPAVGLSWHAATAYADWYAKATGQPWRLPTSEEWEKAARGVDGRRYPFGGFADVSFCHARTGSWRPSTPVGVDAMPDDVSPYGVLGAAGNVRQWCADRVDDAARDRGDSGARVLDELRTVAGGSYLQPLEACRVTSRAALRPDVGYPDVGVRLVRSLDR